MSDNEASARSFRSEARRSDARLDSWSSVCRLDFLKKLKSVLFEFVTSTNCLSSEGVTADFLFTGRALLCGLLNRLEDINAENLANGTKARTLQVPVPAIGGH